MLLSTTTFAEVNFLTITTSRLRSVSFRVRSGERIVLSGMSREEERELRAIALGTMGFEGSIVVDGRPLRKLTTPAAQFERASHAELLMADTIYVFDRGGIVQEGRHVELMKQHHGKYAREIVRQNGSFAP